MNPKNVKTAVLGMLNGGSAFLPAEKILDGINPENRHKKLPGATHTIWQLLEHLRIAQDDILNYCLDPSWQSPHWPEGYWPAADTPPDEIQWQNTVSSFYSGLQQARELVENKVEDISAPIPHSPKHTFLREILVLAEHNAYHLGQIMQIRKRLNDLRDH